MTLRLRQHVWNLRAKRTFRILERAFARARERNGMRLCHFSVQGNHVHLIVEARDAEALGRGMKGLSVRIARGLNRLMGRSGPVVADRYHARILRTPREVRHALAYVLKNLHHHARQWGRPVGDAVLDPYASGPWFDGWRGGVPDMGGWVASSGAFTGAGPPVAPAHTWLLRIGWRRHGLLAPV